jgi:DNA-binding transcriptional ArsR family regulator
MDRALDRRLTVLQELADAVRLGVVTHLEAHGPATASELSEAVAASRPQISNHLRRLREAQLVRATRAGRHTVFELADPSVTAVLEALRDVRPGATALPAPSGFAKARTCFDHLAGRLGVLIRDRLVEVDALRPREDGNLAPGPQSRAELARLGVALDDIAPGRRRFAFECLDSTEHRSHVGGVLGDEIAHALTERGWVVRNAHHREVELTHPGIDGLARALRLPVRDVRSQLG